MALEKVILPLVIDGGINTKIDSRMLPLGNNLELVNVELDKIGVISKKVGSSKVSSLCDDGSDLSTKSITQIFSYKNEILAMGRAGTNDIYSYQTINNKWVKKNGLETVPAYVERERVYGEKIDSKSPSMCDLQSKNIRVVSYLTDSPVDSYLKVLIEDTTTGTTKELYSYKNTTASSILQAKVNIVDQSNPVLFITYFVYTNDVNNYGRLNVRVMNVDGTFINEVNLYNTGTNDEKSISFNTEIIDDELFVVNRTIGDENLLTTKTDINGNITTLVIQPVSKYIFSPFSITVNNNIIYISFCKLNNDIAVIGIDSINLLLSYLEKAIFTGIVDASLIKYNRPGIMYAGNNKILVIGNSTYNEINDMLLTTIKVDYMSIAILDISTNIVTFISNEYLDLTSQPFIISSYANKVFFIGQIMTLYETKYCLYSVDINLMSVGRVGAFNQKNASNDSMESNSFTPVGAFNYLERPIIKNNEIFFISMFYDRLLAFGNSDFRPNIRYISSIQLVKICLDKPFYSVKMGENIMFSGLNIKEYDGRLLFSNNYILPPTIFLPVPSYPGLISTADDFDYTYILESVDANSQITRSSPAYSQPRYANPVNPTMNVTIYFRSLSDSTLSRQYPLDDRKISAAFYKTSSSSGTIYERIPTFAELHKYFYGSSDNYYPHDNPYNGNADFLYTNGGVLPNEQIPPVSHMITANGRVFALSSEDKNVVFYSQPYLFGECVNFNENLSFRIDGGLLSRSGFGVGLANLDGKIIILKDRSILGIQGTGPNFAGENNNFTDPELISSSIGCVDARSIVTVPQGVMFKSSKGIYLLNRSLQLEYIGAPVEDYNSETIVKAIDDSDENRVIFQTTNRQLIFDYAQGKWWTSDQVLDDLIDHNGTIYYLKNSLVYKRDNTLFKNDGVNYSMKVVTPWVKMSGAQNEQRLYEIMILGKYFSDHDLTVKVYYDYENSDVDTYTIYPLITDENYQYRIKPARQKCQACKIEVSDVPRGTGQSCEISNVSLRLGQKKGMHDLADGRKY